MSFLTVNYAILDEEIRVNSSRVSMALSKETLRPIHDRHKFSRRYQLALTIFKDLLPGKVLEVGCGDGDFLRKLVPLKYEVTGIDIFPEYAREGRDVNVKCHDANLGLPYQDRTFDYIICFETISHLVDPPAFLNEVKRVHQDERILLLDSINVANWRHRISFILAETKNFEMIWETHKGTHLHIYSLDSLKRLLESRGFAVTDLSRKLSGPISRLLPFINNLVCNECFFMCHLRPTTNRMPVAKNHAK